MRATRFRPNTATSACRREALERHIAYDIGAAWATRRLAARLNAPGVLSTFSRLLIDPNRGADDPTLVMRFSDGAIVPGNAHVDAEEIERRRRRYWAPYREADPRPARDDAGDRPPAGDRLDALVHAGLARRRAALEDRRAVGPRPAPAEPLSRALRAEPDISDAEVGDNEPYDGALAWRHDRRLRDRARPFQRADRSAPGPDRDAGRRPRPGPTGSPRYYPPLLVSESARAPRHFGSRGDAGA